MISIPCFGGGDGGSDCRFFCAWVNHQYTSLHMIRLLKIDPSPHIVKAVHDSP